MFCLFIHPVNWKSTGETTGGVVGKRNRNVVTNDQLPDPCCKRALVEMIVIVYVLFFLIHPLTLRHRVNILRKSPAIGMIVIVYVLLFYSPGELEVNG
jgi:p-aminobenzoyl-glutamate transporter AbgT